MVLCGKNLNQLQLCKTHKRFIPPIKDFKKVSKLTQSSEVMGEVVAIEPKDAIPVGNVPVKVCVNVDISMPMRRGFKCSTYAGVTKWQQFFYERQPKNICMECYIINHSKNACEAAAIFLKKAHDKPYFMGKVNNVRKTINAVKATSELASTKVPIVKTSQKNFVKSTSFIRPKDGEVINLDSILREEGITTEDDSRLGKRHRLDEVADKGHSTLESTPQSTMVNPISAFINTQQITTGDNSSLQAHKGNQDKSCIAEIAKAWEKYVNGSAAFKLIKRLQFTRIILSRWNKTHFRDINQHADDLRNKLNTIQSLPCSQENSSQALEVSKELQRWHQIQHDFNKQKSRDTFLNDIDNNTKYFHTLTKRKRSRNNIYSMKDDDGYWVHSRDEVASLLTKHFKDISTSSTHIIKGHHYNHIPTLIT
ncbi:uncharacterized protein LOC113324276 [Papaver somniferum]|uniref:uncharacterized protein LOC113324276 n=1 Tax=Papaver somniferum TaxID=3469 RepID=UPI000E70138A|nr:uncharacterized protein LOC113324276 [Papaver somniferum]